MKKKPKKKDDLVVLMTKIQEQLAILDNKLDSFMTKSLTELAQALAAKKPIPIQTITVPTKSFTQQQERPARTMYSVVCFQCGDDCEIPFKPSGNRPVYCKKCFVNRKSNTQTPSTPFKPLASESNRVKTPTFTVSKSKTKKKPATKKAATKKKATTKKKVTTKKKSTAKKTVAKKKKVTKKKSSAKKKPTAKKKIIKKKKATKNKSKR